MKKVIAVILISCISLGCSMSRDYFYTGKDIRQQGKYPFRIWITGEFEQDTITIVVNDIIIINKFFCNTISSPSIGIVYENDTIMIMRDRKVLDKKPFKKSRYLRIRTKLNDEYTRFYLFDLKRGKNFMFNLTKFANGDKEISFSQFKKMPYLQHGTPPDI